MTLDDQLRSLIHNRAAEAELFAGAVAQGMRPMREDGQRLLEQGITALEEVLRVTPD
jgi:general secretion pathway protein E